METNFQNSCVSYEKNYRTTPRSARVVVLSALVFVGLCIAAKAVWACNEPANGFFVPEASGQDTTLPVLNSVSSIVWIDGDGCGGCGGEYWILSVDGEDPEVTGTRNAPALGYRIEVLSGTVYLNPDFPLLEAHRFSEQALPAIYLYGDIDKEAMIRITPIDRAGNEGVPIEHTLDAFVETGGSCSTQGHNSGLGMLPLLGAFLLALRRGCTSD